MSDPAGTSLPVPADLADNSKAVKISTEVMVVAVIFLFVVVLFVFVLYLYARRFFSPHAVPPRRRPRFVFAPDLAPRRGLDAALLLSLPVKSYQAAGDDADRLDCAVCLSEVADGEKVRLLPGCSHGFHLECIDMWFHSNSTCPLCRTVVSGEVRPPDFPDLPTAPESQTPRFPTNVLFWGTGDSPAPETGSSPAAIAGDGVGSRGSGGLVIEIPSRRGAVEGFVSPAPAEGSKSSPVSARFRSIRKLWSRGKLGEEDGDVEMGFGGFFSGAGESSSRTPKTPGTPRTPTTVPAMNLKS